MQNSTTVRTCSMSEMHVLLVRHLHKRGAAKALAIQCGVTEAAISNMKAGKLPVSEKVAARLGYRREVVWVPIGPQRARI
jgi:lambda repressor-like predicted transcriptional regulator